jgi:hypothetical protein
MDKKPLMRVCACGQLLEHDTDTCPDCLGSSLDLSVSWIPSDELQYSTDDESDVITAGPGPTTTMNRQSCTNTISTHDYETCSQWECACDACRVWRQAQACPCFVKTCAVL